MSSLTKSLQDKFKEARKLFDESGLGKSYLPVFDHSNNLHALENEKNPDNRNALRKMLKESKKVVTSSIKNPEIKTTVQAMIEKSTTSTANFIDKFEKWARLKPANLETNKTPKSQ